VKVGLRLNNAGNAEKGCEKFVKEKGQIRYAGNSLLQSEEEVPRN